MANWLQLWPFFRYKSVKSPHSWTDNPIEITIEIPIKKYNWQLVFRAYDQRSDHGIFHGIVLGRLMGFPRQAMHSLTGWCMASPQGRILWGSTCSIWNESQFFLRTVRWFNQVQSISTKKGSRWIKYHLVGPILSCFGPLVVTMSSKDPYPVWDVRSESRGRDDDAQTQLATCEVDLHGN